MLVAAAWSLDLTSALNAAGLTDVLLGVLWLVLSTLTAIASALVVVDVRTEVAAARAWQGINAEVTLVGTPPEMVPASRTDARYFVGPQDEGLQRILLAHRFVMPVPSPSDAIQRAPVDAHAIVVGGFDGARATSDGVDGPELAILILGNVAQIEHELLGCLSPRATMAAEVADDVDDDEAAQSERSPL